MTDRHDPFGRSALPPTFDRESRVRLLAAVARALIEGREPDRAAAMFVGSAISDWLEHGGPVGTLERDYFRVAARRGSHRTPAQIARCTSGDPHRDEGAEFDDGR